MRQYRLRYQRRSGIGELVAGSPDGEDVARLGRIGFDLLAQPLDQRVDASLGDVRVPAPHALDQRVAAEDDAAAARQHVEQVELVRGEIDVGAVDAGEAPRRIDV